MTMATPPPPGDPPSPVDAGPGGEGEAGRGQSGGMTSDDAALPLSTDHLFSTGTLWDVAVDSDEADTHVDMDWHLRLCQGREMRGAMNLRAIDRLRDELDRIPGDAAPTDPVTLRAADAVLIARMLLSRIS